MRGSQTALGRDRRPLGFSLPTLPEMLDHNAPTPVLGELQAPDPRGQLRAEWHGELEPTGCSAGLGDVTRPGGFWGLVCLVICHILGTTRGRDGSF